MRASVPWLTAAALVACAPKTPVTEAPTEAARVLPEPLEARPFKMPATERRTLSNGIEVIVATNDEVPLFDVRMVFDVGGADDPAGLEGLASATMDMLDEGAGDLTAEDISRATKRLGSRISTWGDTDLSGLGASGLERNLEQTLDLWATILTEPTFPEDDWTILRDRRIADVVASREDPTSISRTISYRVLYGDHYRGRQPSEASYQAMTTSDMRAFYRRRIGPENAKIFAGGALTAEELVPLLEERIGSWAPEGIDASRGEVSLETPDHGVLYFVDKPGAAQSVVRVGFPVGTRHDEDYFPFFMANEVIGGNFTSRVNMNLREDKGYTYGARCFLGEWDGPGVWGCSTSVQTAVTGPALSELMREIDDALGDRKITSEELGYFQSMQANAFAQSYETTSSVLDEQMSLWRYELPESWPETYVDDIRAVTVNQANTAFHDRIDPSKLLWSVVGDKASVWQQLTDLGLEIIELDREGNPIEGE